MKIIFKRVGFMVAVAAMAFAPSCTDDGDDIIQTPGDEQLEDTTVDYGDSDETIPRLTLGVDLTQAQTLNSDVYGINNSLVTEAYDESNPSFASYYKGLSAPATRFPGGDIANFYYYNEGFAIDIPSGAYSDQVNAYNSLINQNKLYEGHNDVPLFNLLADTGGSLCLVLNISSGLSDSNTCNTTNTKAYLQKIKNDCGVVPKYIEMGHELYKDEYAPGVTSATNYTWKVWANEANVDSDTTNDTTSFTDVINSVCPSASVGVSIPDYIYTGETPATRQTDWTSRMQGQTSRYDAVTIHMYSDTGDAESYVDAYKNCLSHSDAKFSSTLNDIATTYTGKDIWVTEYHADSYISDDEDDRFHHSYLGGLFASTNLLKLFKSPEVKLATWSSMVDWLNYTRTVNYVLLPDNYNFGVKINMNFFGMFADAVRNSNKFVDVTVSDTDGYTGTLDSYTDQYADVEAGMFYNSSDQIYYLAVINKLDNEYAFEIDDFIANTLKLTSFGITESSYIKPLGTDEASLSLEEESDCEMDSIIRYNDGVVVFAPYSVNIIKIGEVELEEEIVDEDSNNEGDSNNEDI